MRRSVGAVVAALLTFAACRTPPAVPPLPSKGGPNWVEVSTAHFTVWTDAPERSRELVQTMERLREVVFGTALFSGRDPGYRTFVIALANKHWRECERERRASSVWGDLLSRPRGVPQVRYRYISIRASASRSGSKVTAGTK